MATEDVQNQIRQRLSLVGQVVVATGVLELLFFAAILGMIFLEMTDMEKEALNGQIRTYAFSNSDNFEIQNVPALKKAAMNLMKSKTVSHIVIFDPQGRPLLWLPSPKITPTQNDLPTLQLKVQREAKLTASTSGSSVVSLKLPSGMSLYRTFLTIQKGPARLGGVEIGYFRPDITADVIQNLQATIGICAACFLVSILLIFGMTNRWEKRKSREILQYFQTQLDQQKGQYERKLVQQRREHESKDVDGGSFFNILESVREISGSPDLPMFVRRTVLSCVRLFRCRMVSFYLCQPDGNQKSENWNLMGRYDGKGYFHELSEKLEVTSSKQLKDALAVGATELLEGYPAEKTQSLVISITADKILGAVILYNKVGNFDGKDVLAGRIFAGFLPNLLAWHTKS